MSLVLCCRDAMARLTERDEGALSGAEAATFGCHLIVCSRCRRYRAQLDMTVGALRAMPREKAKPEDVDAVLRLLERGGTSDD